MFGHCLVIFSLVNFTSALLKVYRGQADYILGVSNPTMKCAKFFSGSWLSQSSCKCDHYKKGTVLSKDGGLYQCRHSADYSCSQDIVTVGSEISFKYVCISNITSVEIWNTLDGGRKGKWVGVTSEMDIHLHQLNISRSQVGRFAGNLINVTCGHFCKLIKFQGITTYPVDVDSLFNETSTTSPPVSPKVTTAYETTSFYNDITTSLPLTTHSSSKNRGRDKVAHEQNNDTVLIIIVVLVIVVLLSIVAALVFYCCFWKQRALKKKRDHRLSTMDITGMGETCDNYEQMEFSKKDSTYSEVENSSQPSAYYSGYIEQKHSNQEYAELDVEQNHSDNREYAGLDEVRLANDTSKYTVDRQYAEADQYAELTSMRNIQEYAGLQNTHKTEYSGLQNTHAAEYAGLQNTHTPEYDSLQNMHAAEANMPTYSVLESSTEENYTTLSDHDGKDTYTDLNSEGVELNDSYDATDLHCAKINHSEVNNPNYEQCNDKLNLNKCETRGKSMNSLAKEEVYSGFGNDKSSHNVYFELELDN